MATMQQKCDWLTNGNVNKKHTFRLDVHFASQDSLYEYTVQKIRQPREGSEIRPSLRTEKEFQQAYTVQNYGQEVTKTRRI